jgi:hypothetical protein
VKNAVIINKERRSNWTTVKSFSSLKGNSSFHRFPINMRAAKAFFVTLRYYNAVLFKVWRHTYILWQTSTVATPVNLIENNCLWVHKYLPKIIFQFQLMLRIIFVVWISHYSTCIANLFQSSYKPFVLNQSKSNENHTMVARLFRWFEPKMWENKWFHLLSLYYI